MFELSLFSPGKPGFGYNWLNKYCLLLTLLYRLSLNFFTIYATIYLWNAKCFWTVEIYQESTRVCVRECVSARAHEGVARRAGCHAAAGVSWVLLTSSMSIEVRHPPLVPGSERTTFVTVRDTLRQVAALPDGGDEASPLLNRINMRPAEQCSTLLIEWHSQDMTSLTSKETRRLMAFAKDFFF